MGLRLGQAANQLAASNPKDKKKAVLGLKVSLRCRV